jgi:hypothetical protein
LERYEVDLQASGVAAELRDQLVPERRRQVAVDAGGEGAQGTLVVEAGVRNLADGAAGRLGGGSDAGRNGLAGRGLRGGCGRRRCGGAFFGWSHRSIKENGHDNFMGWGT